MELHEFKKDLKARILHLASVTSVEKTVDFINLMQYALTKANATEVENGSEIDHSKAQTEDCSSDEERTVSGESEVSGSGT